MKKLAVLVLATVAFAAGGTAIAGPKAEVVEKDAKGHPTKVSIDGQTYAVCTATVTDACVNPRQAGLKWGNTPLGDWPGHPASEKTPAK